MPAAGCGSVLRMSGNATGVTVLRRAFGVGIVRDRAMEALSLAVLCGAVVSAGVAVGVEIAGGVAVFATRMRLAGTDGRYHEIRHDGDRWTLVCVDGGVVAIEPPVVHFAHRLVVVLEVAVGNRTDFLVFSPFATPPDDLRRLRVRLRAGGLSW